MSKELYRPLPSSVTIKPSSIEGLGLHATEEIEEWELLGISHIANNSFPNGWIRTPLGGFVNHSKKPNCKFIEVIDTDAGYTRMELYTTQIIRKGEELVVKYTLYNPENNEE